MDMSQLIEQARAQRASLESQRSGLVAEQRSLVDALPDGGSLDDAGQGRFDEISRQKADLATRIDAASAAVTRLEAEKADDERLTAQAEERHDSGTYELLGDTTDAGHTRARELTYTARKASQESVSFFSDLYRSQTGAANPEIGARLQAHLGEARDAERLSERAIGTGNLGGLVPPQYLVDEAAAIARAGRPTANIVRHLQLPAKGQSLIIPRGTTGTTEAIQATQNSAVSNTDYAVTDLTIPVATIAGQQDVSRQALERGEGVDSIIFADLVADYAVKLDAQVLSGTGSSGQMLGIFGTAGITQMSAFTAAATITTFYSKIAGAVVAVQSGRFLAPSGIIVHPRRFGWLVASVDSAGRPLFVPNTNGPFNANGIYDDPKDVPATEPVGWVQGIPVYTDASIPTAVGTGPEDQVIVARLADLMLWEDGDGTPQQLRFEQTTGGSLTVKLVAYGYAAFTAGRYPLATAIVGGNAGTIGYGLAAPTF